MEYKNNNINDNINNTEQINENQRRICLTIKSFVLNIHVWILFIICFLCVQVFNSLPLLPLIPLLPLLKELFIKTLYSVKTVSLLTFLSYIIHYASHNFRNIFTITHHYHHETNNKVCGDILQINLEFLASVISAYIFKLDIVEVIHFFLIYTTIHNINYGYYHVNTIHEEHHKDILKNIGPDICDILFNTKLYKQGSKEEHHIPRFSITKDLWTIIKILFQSCVHTHIYKYDKPTDDDNEIEDIGHIIPNILGSTILVLILSKCLNTFKTKTNNTYTYIPKLFKMLVTMCAITYIISSLYLYIKDEHPDKVWFI